MLTIENYSKLYKKDVGDWRIGKVENMKHCYLIHLYKPNGERIQVNLERNPIGEKETALYELWYWKGMANNPQNQKPQRMLLSITSLNPMSIFLKNLNLLIQ